MTVSTFPHVACMVRNTPQGDLLFELRDVRIFCETLRGYICDDGTLHSSAGPIKRMVKVGYFADFAPLCVDWCEKHFSGAL